jgi:hypothetical protein
VIKPKPFSPLNHFTIPVAMVNPSFLGLNSTLDQWAAASARLSWRDFLSVQVLLPRSPGYTARPGLARVVPHFPDTRAILGPRWRWWTVAKQRSTFGKLERAKVKQERAKSKKERRAARGVAEPGDRPVSSPQGEDESHLLKELAELQAAFGDGRMSLDEFESQRDDLRARLAVD